MYTYYISVGSNMGNRQQYLQLALNRLREHPAVEDVRSSSWIETAPWGNTNQDPFLNAVYRCETTLDPHDFLHLLQCIEQEAKRERVIHWGPRTLDLDIVYGYVQDEPLEVHTDELDVPHPYFWERTFVLVPLRELVPDFFYQCESIAYRIAKLESNT